MKKILLLSVIGILIFSCKDVKKESQKPIEAIVRGLVRIVGNEPHTEVLVYGSTESDPVMREYYVAGSAEIDLRPFAGKTVTVKGMVKMHSLRLAGDSGKSLERYVITPVELVSPLK